MNDMLLQNLSVARQELDRAGESLRDGLTVSARDHLSNVERITATIRAILELPPECDTETFSKLELSK